MQFMDLKSESVVLGSVETDSNEIINNRASENQGSNDEARVENNGSAHDVEHDRHGDSDIRGKETDVSGLGSSLPVDVNSETSPSPTVTRKGYGLRKWRRIKRDSGKSGDGIINTSSQFVAEERSSSGLNPSKRVQVYADRKEKSENSVSSTNAVVTNLEGFALIDEPSLTAEALFGAGTDSENSEDRSSKSSTAASGHPVNHLKPVVVGSPHDKSRLRSLSGKNLTHSGQRGQHGKVRVETIKKHRGGPVKVEKETSLSSVESDSCSSNFVFMPGNSIMNNGTLGDCNGENDAHQDGKERYENISANNGVAESSWKVKENGNEVNGFSADKDPVVEAINSLDHAQDALEKEMLKFRELSKLVEDSISDIHTEATDDEQNVQEASSEPFQSPKVVRFSKDATSKVAQTDDEDAEKEFEELLKEKIEIEVEYLAISGVVRNLRVDALDQITLLKEQTLASEQTQILYKLGDTRDKAVMLKKEAEDFEKVCKELASAEESLKLQKRICKYTLFFFLQLVVWFFFRPFKFIFESQRYEEVVPT